MDRAMVERLRRKLELMATGVCASQCGNIGRRQDWKEIPEVYPPVTPDPNIRKSGPPRRVWPAGE